MNLWGFARGSQGWMFNYQRYIWNKDTVKALLDSVPDDRMLILDYANDYKSNWDVFDGFYGKPWIMGYVPNMGGKTAYTGRMNFYARGAADMLKHPLKGNNVGFTISGEGLENNQVLYELMSDTAWSSDPINPDTWLEGYCRARYGNGYPAEMRTAWDLYRKTCYGTFTPHPRFGWQGLRCGHGSVNRDPRFTLGVKSFLACRDQFRNSPSYKDDALEMAAISLSLKADEWFLAARRFYDIGDIAGMNRLAGRGLDMLLDIDRLLESHSLNRLERWIAPARLHSNSREQSDRYEHNARQIITVWGPPVNDYSARMWSGLIRDFYQPRMAAYFAGLSGTPFNRKEWENRWVQSTGISPVKPFADPVAKAAELLEEAYAEKIPSTPVITKGDILGEWNPDMVSGEWQSREWSLTAEQLKKLKGVRFIYTRGHHKLDIKSVALIADGREVAREVHDGSAGDKHIGNTYLLKIPKDISANNGAQIRAVIRSTHGANSYGTVQLINKPKKSS